MGCFHCSCCCKASNDSGMQFRSRERTVGCFRCPKLLSDKENGGKKSRISSQRNDDLPEKNHCCFSCMKPSKANSEFTRKEDDGNCFAWFMTSNKVNERRRGSRIDSSSCCHSKTKDDSPESRGCCLCFPYFRKPSKDAHSRNELKDKNCTFCLCPLGSSKKKKEATRNGCAERFCCKESLPKDDSTKRKGICCCSCVPPKKLSKIGIDYNAESKNKNSFLCFSSTTAEAKEKNKKGCGIGRSDCCDTSSKEDSTGKSGHYCCSCFSRKKSANKKIDSRERKNKNCFYCFMSSKDEGKERSKIGCGIGCSCCCDSSSKHFSTERKGHRCCSCFPHKKSSKIEIESRRERKSKEVGKARNKKGLGNGCLCCCDSLSKEDSAEQRGHFCCKCFSHKKLSRREIDSREERKNKNCISCFGSSKEKGKERNKNECGVGCSFCFDSSSKDDSTEGSGHFQCCCFPHKKPSKQDNDFRGESNNKQYFSCFRSSKKEDLERNNKEDEIGCSCCFDSSSKHHSPKSSRSLCLYPSRSSKEGSDFKKGKGNGCFSCFKLNKEDSSVVEKKKNSCCFCNINKKKTGQDSAKKRGSKVMCCSAFCCTKSLDEGKPASKAKCTLGCICCVHSDCYQHMPIDRRKKKLCSDHVQEQPQVVNRSSTMMHIPSLKSDIDGKNRSHANQIAPLSNCSNSVQVFKYKELVAATKSFSEDFLLGSGAIGGTYKGELLEKNQVVAIKEIKRDVNQGGNEFHVDVIMLSLIHHANLVKLLGYCAEREQMILVSEYMPFGSLQDHLFDLKPNNKPLDWFTRMKIATGVAKGLEHLHDMSNPPIVFRDMKASNILLDEDYNAKLSDFGLEKPLSVMGTYGCCAPEYALTRKFTKTTDVYGFGVLLLELITGRKAIDSTRPKKEQYLSHWVAPLFKDKRRFLTLVDPLLNGCYPIKGLYQALAIANICLQNEANSRPFMSDVVTAIEYLVKPEADLSKSLEEPSIPHQSIPSSYEMLMFQHSPRNSCRRKNTMSFDEESFQSLTSDTECCGPLREEDDIQEEE